MPKTQTIQNSFVAGEVSPFYLGRTDQDKYRHACESLQNYIVKPTGGAVRRIGTTYICDAGSANRLMRFVISTEQSYVLEFGNLGMRFYTKHQQIQTSPGVPYQIATPYNMATDDLWDLKLCQLASVAYITHPNHPPYKLVRISDTNWLLVPVGFFGPPTTKADLDYSDGVINISISGNTATASQPFFINGDVGRAIVVPGVDTGVGFIYAVGGGTGTDGSTGADLYTQAYMTVTSQFLHSNYSPGQWLMRGGPLAYFSVGYMSSSGSYWHASSQFNFGKQITIRSTTKHPTDSTYQTVSGGSYVNVAYGGGFTDSFRMLDANSYIPFAGGYCWVNTINTSDSITATVMTIPSVTETNAYGNSIIAPTSPGGWWFEQATFGPGNYPRAVAAFQDRIYFASTPNNPATFWASVTGDYENFSLGTEDTDGLRFTINSGSLDQILWMVAFQGSLVAGTYQGEYLINGGAGQNVQSPGVPITPTNIDVIRQSTFGDSRVQALLARADVIYVQRTGTELYEFTFNALTNAYDSKQLNLLAETIITGTVKELAYQNFPWHVIWIIDTSGNLVGMTYDKANDVYAWHRHFTGNLDLSNNTDKFISVCTIPSDDPLNGQEDDTYFLVQRQRAGTTVYTIECFIDQNLNLDCAVHTVFSTPVTQLTGLQYLQGRGYWVVADGNIFPSNGLGNSAGTFNFPPDVSATDVQVGLMYNSYIQTVRFERGVTQGLVKRWIKIWSRLYQSVNLLINGNQRIPFRTTTTIFNGSTPRFTGDVNVNNVGFDRDARITFTQDQPLPSTILATFGTVEVSDGV